MTTPLDRAKQRLAVLRSEIREIERFIEMYETFDHGSVSLRRLTSKETVESAGGTTHSVDKFAVDRDVPIPPPSPRRRNETPPKAIVELVERMIREAGQPLTRGEILDRLQARDVEITVADKARYVGTIMWRNKSKFINIEGRGYWLRGEAIPPHSHITAGRPEDEDEDIRASRAALDDGWFKEWKDKKGFS